MTSQILLFIILAALVSFGIVVYMYGYKSKLAKRLRWILGILRFCTLFLVLVLLINPKFTRKTFAIEKPTLSILVDNSLSIKELKEDSTVVELVNKLKNNKALIKKFNLSFFTFGNQFKELDTLNFSEKNTQIAKALTTTTELINKANSPVLLITDGNQTVGTDYSYISKQFKSPVYSIVVGDTTQFSDLKIEQLNTNRYSFLKNKFPVEAILVYSGKEAVTSQFTIKQGNSTVFKQAVRFTARDNVKTIALTLPASRVGLQKYTAALVPLENEKNKTNNYRRFAVEVIDQTTKVLVVSDIKHPDLGTLKKAIETNKQRSIFFKNSTQAAPILNDYQLIILYQPTATFSAVFEALKRLKKNYFIISGKQTQWSYLNQAQTGYFKEVTTQTEEVLGQLNSNYSNFSVEDIGFSDFPPLETRFGSLEIQVPNAVILDQNIDGYKTNSALLATTELNGFRTAILDGEGIWKWRMQTYLKNNDFKAFDDFIGKMVQYLASNKKRSRLDVSSNSFYYGNKAVLISAQYFDKNYEFDNRVTLFITVINKETEKQTVYPMLLKNNFYQVDLSSLEAGEYTYTVSVKEEEVSRSGTFTILEYQVEQQFLSPDVTKLEQLATHTNGKMYFPNQYTHFVNEMIDNELFKQIEKAEEKTVPLIHWKLILALLIGFLTLEWLLRKYNGLI